MTTPTHAILFQPFYIIETYQLREIQPFIHSWETTHKLRYHSAHPVTRPLWHVTPVTCDPRDMWPPWHVTTVTCDPRDMWPLWHVTRRTINIPLYEKPLTNWGTTSVTRPCIITTSAYAFSFFFRKIDLLLLSNTFSFSATKLPRTTWPKHGLLHLYRKIQCLQSQAHSLPRAFMR